MGFDNFARKVSDTSLPYGHRVVSLRSCAQLYRPIGFRATVSYLEAKAGPFRHDEAALLRALGVIRASRALWQADVRAYAEKRGEAKRRGLRSPRPGEANPLVPAYWYGAPREAALHALAHWRRGLRQGRGQGEELVREMERLSAECVAGGRTGLAPPCGARVVRGTAGAADAALGVARRPWRVPHRQESALRRGTHEDRGRSAWAGVPLSRGRTDESPGTRGDRGSLCPRIRPRRRHSPECGFPTPSTSGPDPMNRSKQPSPTDR
jgi:hypothetical protein